jgi:hypothetical protein
LSTVDGYNEIYNNQLYDTDKIFIYYDQKHTVGIDFKQPYKMHGLVTISNKTTITQLSQGIFRLRNINYSHMVDYYSCYSDINEINRKINENENNYKGLCKKK